LSPGLVILKERSVGNFTNDGVQSVIILLQPSRQETWHGPQEVLELGNDKGVPKEGESIMG